MAPKFKIGDEVIKVKHISSAPSLCRKIGDVFIVDSIHPTLHYKHIYFPKNSLIGELEEELELATNLHKLLLERE